MHEWINAGRYTIDTKTIKRIAWANVGESRWVAEIYLDEKDDLGKPVILSVTNPDEVKALAKYYSKELG